MTLDTFADLPHTEQLPRRRDWMFKSLRGPARAIVNRFWKINIHGREQLPPRGPMILVANHLGVLDGPLLVIAHPQPTYALAKVELFSGPLGTLLQYVGQISIDRHRADLRGVTRAIHLLRTGGVLAVFPEGKRTGGEVAMAERGAAYLAMVTGAPVVPVALLGTRGPGKTTGHVPGYHSPLHIAYGKPMQVPLVPWPRTKIAVAEWTERIRQRLADHIVASEELTGMRLPGPPSPRIPKPARRLLAFRERRRAASSTTRRATSSKGRPDATSSERQEPPQPLSSTGEQ